MRRSRVSRRRGRLQRKAEALLPPVPDPHHDRVLPGRIPASDGPEVVDDPELRDRLTFDHGTPLIRGDGHPGRRRRPVPPPRGRARWKGERLDPADGKPRVGDPDEPPVRLAFDLRDRIAPHEVGLPRWIARDDAEDATPAATRWGRDARRRVGRANRRSDGKSEERYGEAVPP